MSTGDDPHDDRKDRLEGARELPPFFEALGLVVEEITGERTVVRMETPPHFVTNYGMVHGGIVGALIDTVGGICVAMKLEPTDRTATHSLDVHYTSFVPAPGVCRCTGRVVAMGKTTATVELEVHRDDGTLAAKALGTFGIFRGRNG